MPFESTITAEVERQYGRALYTIVRIRLKNGDSPETIAGDLGYANQSSLRYALARQGYAISTQRILTQLPRKRESLPPPVATPPPATERNQP
jgi:hypothetical protein